MFGSNAKTYAAALEDLHRVEPSAGRVLAHATGDDVDVLACDNLLAVRRGSEWEVRPWETLQGGGWISDADMLRWVVHEGPERSVRIEQPGRVPEVFQEQVSASIILTETVETSAGPVKVAGRRPLGRGAKGGITWQVVPVGRTKLDDPVVAAAVEDALLRLRADYADL